MISYHGTGNLVQVNGNLNKNGYLKILEESYLPQALLWDPSGEMKLLHDGAPCHKAKVITEFLIGSGIGIVDWPGNSPDLNQIENIWSMMKRKIYAKPLNSKSQLWNELKKVWSNESSTLETIQNCIDSMPQRILDVIRAKGGHTKY